MGNKSLTCFDCNNKQDSFNMDLPKNKGMTNKNISLIQGNVKFHLFRKKQSNFIKKLKEICIELLTRYGLEFLDKNASERFLQEKRFINNQFPLLFLDETNLKNHSQAYALIKKFYTKHASNSENFYRNLKQRDFHNIDFLPIYRDHQTGLTYFSYFNLLNAKNFGHTIIFAKDDTIVELFISKQNCKIHEGIIYFNNGDVYIGKLYLDKISLLNFEDMEPMKDINVDSNYNKQIKYSESNYNNDNMTVRTKEILKEKAYSNKNSTFNSVLDNLNLNQIEKIVNVHPCDEGIFLKKSTSEVITTSNWDHADPSLWNKVTLCKNEKKLVIEEYQNFNSNETQKIEDFLYFFKSEKLLKNALVFDCLNNAKYGGQVVFRNREIIKQGKGEIEFANLTFYEGGWKNNLFHGEGVFYERFDNSLENKSFSKSTQGTWLNGKLNGKGFVSIENSSIKELCVWRFGRLINKLKILNKKVCLNENILNYLNNDDLMNLISIKNKALFDFFTKNEKAKLKSLIEHKGSMIKSKAGIIQSNKPKKVSFDAYSSADNFISKNNSIENRQTEKDIILKSPGNCLPEESKESDVYVDCISNEEAMDNFKSQKTENKTKEEDSFEKEIPYDPENDEENRFIYKFINDKYKEIDSILNRNWKVMEDKNDFKSFYFDETSGLRSIKTDIVIKENLHVVKDFLMDLTQRHKYNKNLDHIKTIRSIGKSYSIKYMKLKSSFVFDSRDFVTAEKIVEKDDHVVMVSSSFESPKYPPYKGSKRGENKVDVKFNQTLVNTGLKQAARNLTIVKSLLESKK